MASTITRIITITIATLALAAPVAGAMPIRDNAPTSSLAGTTSEPKQDLRNPDNRVPAVPYQQPQTMDPVVRTQQPKPVVDDGGPSPVVFVAPSLALIAMLGAAVIYTRSARAARA
jgi:hypothetical protein